MPEIDNHQLLIDAFVAMMPQKAAVTAKAPVVGSVAAPDDIVGELLQNSEDHYLWDGKWDFGSSLLGTPYPSQSEADFALLGNIVRHARGMGISQEVAADATIRVFEQSGLYRPDKRHRVLTQDIPKLIVSGYSPVSQRLQFQSDGAVSGNGPRLGSGQKLWFLKDF